MEWLDACHIGGTGWATEQTVELPLLRGAASGFLIPIDKNKFGEECVVLASALVFEEEGPPNFCPSFVIPKGMVVSVREVQ